MSSEADASDDTLRVLSGILYPASMLYPVPVQPLLPPWTAVIGFFLGSLAGSFLNMLIWRLPRGKSLVDPAHSICPICGHKLTALDLMPILSWLRTKGKCRHCGAPISSRYLWVEVLVGALFAIVWVQKMTVGLDPDWGGFFAYAAVAAVLVAIIYIDWELYIIPDELNAALLFVGMLYNGMHGHLREAILGAFLGWALIWGFVFLGRVAFGKDAMGDGDVKMMRGVGALVGPTLLLANVGLGVVLGLVGGIVGLAIEANKAKKEGEAPAQEEGTIEATPISTVLFAGVVYLLCLDVLALFVRPLRHWIEDRFGIERVYDAEGKELRGIDPAEEEWEPSATTIPFGPYLAAGALICMLAGGPIERGMKAYWDNATGREAGAAQSRAGRTPQGARIRIPGGANWNKRPG